MRALDDAFTACAQAALAADFDPVPWAQAPPWRQATAYAVAEAALDTNHADHLRAAWVQAMTAQGWRWDRVFDEAAKTHPGIVVGELTRGGSIHWQNVATRVREIGRVRGVRMLGP